MQVERTGDMLRLVVGGRARIEDDDVVNVLGQPVGGDVKPVFRLDGNRLAAVCLRR